MVDSSIELTDQALQQSSDKTSTPNKANDVKSVVVNVASLDTTSSDVPKEFPITLSYRTVQKLGCGAFGMVFKAEILCCNDKDHDQKFSSGICAIKKIRRIEKYDNEREICLLRQLQHDNIIKCFYYFPSVSASNSNVHFINIVLEYMPNNLFSYIKWAENNQQPIPELTIVGTVFQILNALSYIHQLGICHRDVKPSNILFDIENLQVKLCDFGSAKILSATHSNDNSTYIGARLYRAPELLFNNQNYSFGIDIWATGCILGELILLKPLFYGSSSIEVMHSILQLLGTPPIAYMNDICTEFDFSLFPIIEPSINELISNYKIFVRGLLKRMLFFSPVLRPTAKQLLECREFMDYFVIGAINNRHSAVASTFLQLTAISRDGCLNTAFADYR